MSPAWMKIQNMNHVTTVQLVPDALIDVCMEKLTQICHSDTFLNIASVLCVYVCVQILVGELCAFFTKAAGTQEKTIVTADCCYFNPLLRRIIRFLGECAVSYYTVSLLYVCGYVRESET